MAYRDVANALEHLILSKPGDRMGGDLPLVTIEEWEKQMSSNDSQVKLIAGRKAVHVLTGVDDPDDVRTKGMQAFTVFRYSGVRATPYQSSNVHDVTWTVMLDILVKGTIEPDNWIKHKHSHSVQHHGGVEPVAGEHDHVHSHLDLSKELDVGVYSPGRGLLVDYLVNRFMRNPILTPVIRRVDAKPYTALVDGESPIYERGTVDTYIRAVQVEDTTDLNYWTLLWTAGLPNSFLGWWPTTLTFTVTERVSPGVESYG